MQIIKKNYHWWYTPYLLLGLAVIQVAILLNLLLNWPVTLTLVVLNSEVPYWSSMIQDFQTEHPNIHIRLIENVSTTDDIKAIYNSDLQLPKASYDLVYMDIIWLPEFASKEWLRDLSGEIPRAELEKFLTSEVKLGSYEERLYRIPFRSDAGLLFSNADLTTQTPETFDDLLQISLDLKNKVEWGYFWQGQEYEGLVATFVEVLAAHGAKWIDPTTNEVGLDPQAAINALWIDPKTKKVGLDSQAAINALKFLYNTIFEKEVSPLFVTNYTEDNSFEDFEKGKAAFVRGWPEKWARANEDDSPLKGKIKLMQIMNASGKGVSCRGGWGFGIAKNAQHPKAALEAIKFFTGEDFQRKFVLNSSYLPSRKALFYDKEIIEKYPHFSEILQTVENAVLRPPIPQYAQASEILQRYLSAALSNQLTPEEAMKRAARETRELLANSK